MRAPRLRAALAACLLLLAGTAAADQNDPRLPTLFKQLKAAATVEEAAEVEQAIWQAWLRHPEFEDVNILMRGGIAKMAQGDIPGARATFAEITRRAPDFAEGWNKLATVDYMLGDFVGSEEGIGRTLELEPRHFGAISGLGLIALKGDDERAAYLAFKKVLAIHPMQPFARELVDRLRNKYERPT